MRNWPPVCWFLLGVVVGELYLLAVILVMLP